MDTARGGLDPWREEEWVKRERARWVRQPGAAEDRHPSVR
jgi:hypothetical protein